MNSIDSASNPFRTLKGAGTRARFGHTQALPQPTRRINPCHGAVTGSSFRHSTAATAAALTR
jgi:hypothetical protein